MNFVKNTKCNCYKEIGKRFYGQSLRDVAMLQRVYLVHLEPLFRSLLFNFCASERTLSLFSNYDSERPFLSQNEQTLFQHSVCFNTQYKKKNNIHYKFHYKNSQVRTRRFNSVQCSGDEKAAHTICIQTKKLTLSA